MMTERSEREICRLQEEGTEGASASVVAVDLTAKGFRVLEVGWVLRHVFGISMPEAVHLAKTVPK